MYLRVSMPAVSVIVPVYKVEQYVARCAHSLFGQTLEDIEYIFVDDCSPDRSVEIIKEVLDHYPLRKEQAHFVRTPRNGGLGRARLFGLKHARGGYIVHCDSDDAVVPDAYRLMYEKAVAENLDVVTCDYKAIYENVSCVQSQYSEPGHEIADLFAGTVWSTVWSRMSRRRLWDNVFLPGGDMWEDMVFTIQIICKAERIGYIPVPLYLYYRRSNSICLLNSKHAIIKRWYSEVTNVKLILEFLSGVTPVTWKPSDVILFKYRCRLELVGHLPIPQFYRRWRNTFPEVDKVFLRMKEISFQEKKDYCRYYLRLPYLKRYSYLYCRKVLRRIYYRVFFHCDPPVC